MIYEAGKVQAVNAELAGAHTTEMQYDAGEVEAIRGILGTSAKPNMKYGVTGINALKMAMSNQGVDDSGDVESKPYADIVKSTPTHCLWGAKALNSAKVIITTSTGFSVEVNSIANEDNSNVIISPAAYYTDNGLLREITEAFDFFMDDNGYLKIITDKEYFIYLDATKKTKIRAVNIQNDSSKTPRKQLFASLQKTTIETAFKCYNSAGQVVVSYKSTKQKGSETKTLLLEWSPLVYNKDITRSNEIKMLVNIPNFGFNWVIENGVLTLKYGSNSWTMYFDYVSDSAGTHTQPVNCDYIEVEY